MKNRARDIKAILFSFLTLLNLSIFADVLDQNQNVSFFLENMSQATTHEVSKIVPWKDCDLVGQTFRLTDGSTWYTTGEKSLAFQLTEGQLIIVIPISDEVIRGIFPSKAYWVITADKNQNLKLYKAYQINW
jgi:hypothetical protein